MDTVRFGVIGAGQIVRRQHAPAFAEASNASITGIASRNPTKATEAAEAVGVERAYGSYDELLADPAIDAVLIALPMKAHAEWIVKAARAGKHVLCEKPMVLTVAEADAVIEAAQATGVLVMEGFTHLFPAQIAYVRDLLASGRLGAIRAIRAEVLYPTLDWENDTRAMPEHGACVLIEAGCYCTLAIQHFMGDAPLAVHGFAASRPGCDFETSFVGIMSFPGERLGYMCTTMESPFRACCEIITTAGRIEMPELFTGTRLVVHATGEKPEEVTFEPVNRFTLQAEHFADCVLHGRAPIVSLEQSRQNIQTLLALREAGRASAAPLAKG
ncbi:MAG: Gfo/Idh/MocA family oxidoreductase [Phycisphaeraceae bacterium]